MPQFSDNPESVRALFPDIESGWLRFANPHRVLIAHKLDEVAAVLRETESECIRGRHAVGFISYEAAPAFDDALAAFASPPPPLPMAWFAVFDSPIKSPPPPVVKEYIAGKFRPLISAEEYRRAFAKIMSLLNAGDAYQVNFAFPMEAKFIGNSESFFMDLISAQPTEWGGYIASEEWAICSASPECFFVRENDSLMSRPMKGTRPNLPGAADELKSAAKDRAENLMIVDMIRNDMSKISGARNVRAEKLLEIESHPTVVQMTSAVACETRAPLEEIMSALFPCASVTGAPKVSAMRAIRALENRPRGVYCGAIGRIFPGGRAQFNVAIRTAIINKKSGIARYFAGGGVVADSICEDEFAECIAKSQILKNTGDASLIETMRANGKGEIPLLIRHLERMKESARDLGFDFDEKDFYSAVARAINNFPPIKSEGAKIRLLLSIDGKIDAECSPPPPLQKKGESVRAILSTELMWSGNPLLRYKTTRREIYNRAMIRAKELGFDDAILINERGEITETCIANIALSEGGGGLITPPLQCGLLPGVMRAEMIARGELREGIIRGKNLLADDAKVYRLNALRGIEPLAVVAE